MADKTCVKRLQREFKALCKEPVSHVVAKPSPSDILEWHYVLEGSPATPFEGGLYHGKLKFPSDYPFKPPAITMITPNGRFATQKRLCMSMSDFHPETWDPMWSVSTILTGLLSFMMDNSPTSGSLTSTDEDKRRFARTSLDFNCQNPAFRKLFPEYIEKWKGMQREIANPKAPVATVIVEPVVAGGEPVVAGGEPAVVGGEPAAENNKEQDRRPLERFPGWVMAVIVAILCSIMALPLLTSDLKLT